jgi:adenylosuccinate synthase
VHTIVCDLGFGDSGKGSTVDFLCRIEGSNWVIRYNGGAQAAHNVVEPSGRHFTFGMFGSGTLIGANTILGPKVLVNPMVIADEAQGLMNLGVNSPMDKMYVHGDCLVTTPFHIAANRAKEAARGSNRHGSCGMGIGETVQYQVDMIAKRLRREAMSAQQWPLRVEDLGNKALVKFKLEMMARWLKDNYDLEIQWESLVEHYYTLSKAWTTVDDDFIDDVLDTMECVFEGSQGVLLDEWYGFFPYVTRSTTTFENALEFLDGRDVIKMGVVRSYTTRHGPGPMPSQRTDYDIGPFMHPELHNAYGEWMGGWRIGDFDGVAIKYAIEVCGGIDVLTVNHCDYPVAGLVTSYRDQRPDGALYHGIGKVPEWMDKDLGYQQRLTDLLMNCTGVIEPGVPATANNIADYLEVPLDITSHGPTWRDKKVVF